MRRFHLLVFVGVLALLAGCSGGNPAPTGSPSGGVPASGGSAAPSSAGGTPSASGSGGIGLPRPAHVVVVVEENHSPDLVIGVAPYLTSLARQGANFTNSYGVGRPSEPNYVGLFSGSTQGLDSDSCPHTYAAANLGSQLLAAGLGFTGYSESLPHAGYTGCYTGLYARKHVPWVNFSDVPAASNQPFSAFPSDYAKLPTVSFVIPNLCDDMHDCSVYTGDTWLNTRLSGYVTWARTHDSLLIVTFDEGTGGGPNRIPTIFVGPMVRPGPVATRIDHYTVLRTLEAMYGLPCVANACAASPITGIWRG